MNPLCSGTPGAPGAWSCRYKIYGKVGETLGSLGVWDWHPSYLVKGPGRVDQDAYLKNGGK